MEDLNFDNITPIEIPVRVSKKLYILREADEEAVCTWRNSHLKSARVENGKITSLGNLADGEPLLVSLCLYNATEDGKLPVDSAGLPEKKLRVSLPIIRSWPGRIVKKIFEQLKTISEISEEEDTKEALVARAEEIFTKLGPHVDDADDAKKWEEWLITTFRTRTGTGIPPDDHAKNGQSATPATSA